MRPSAVFTAFQTQQCLLRMSHSLRDSTAATVQKVPFALESRQVLRRITDKICWKGTSNFNSRLLLESSGNAKGGTTDA